ncbi:hypothetical protein U1Q18_002568 [Sarracenia purpurea var. burkii]
MQSFEDAKSDILLALIVGGSPLPELVPNSSLPELVPGSSLCGGFRGRERGGARWYEQSSPYSHWQINAKFGPLEEWRSL